jgi:hypothetical protein
MGGLGSGRREYATTPTVAECRTLDADTLTEYVDVDPAADAHLDLRWGENTEIRAYLEHGDRDAGGTTTDTDEIDTEAGTDDVDQDGDRDTDQDQDLVDALRLVYTTRPDTDDATRHEYHVPVEYTEPHFGGVRPWFACPGCGSRRRKLYLPPRREVFACRECYDLGYRSSRTSGDDVERAEQRYRNAFAKADAESRRPHPNNLPAFPERPKGMHQDTFEDLVADVEAAREEWDRAFHRKLADMTARLETTLDSLG